MTFFRVFCGLLILGLGLGCGLGTGYAPSRYNYFVYVSNQSASTISGFQLDINTGNLTSLSGFPMSTAPSAAGMSVDPRGRFLYVGLGANGYTSYIVNATTGALTLVSSPGAPGGAHGSVSDPTGSYLYAVDSSNFLSLFTIGTDGSIAQVVPATQATASDPYGVVEDPSGQFLFTSNYLANSISQFTVNSSNGYPSPNGTVTTGGLNGPDSIVQDPTGTYYYVANSSLNGGVSGFQRSGGNLTALSGSPFVVAGQTPQAVGIDPNSRFVYLGNGNGAINVFSISAGGNLTLPPGSYSACPGILEYFSVDPTGRYILVPCFAGSLSVMAVNSSGVLTLLNNYATGAGSTVSVVVAAPHP